MSAPVPVDAPPVGAPPVDAPPADDGAGVVPTAADRPRGLDARPGVPVAVLVVAYAATRIWAAIAGVRYDDSVLRGTPLTDMWQLLDVRLLRHHLVDSVWHLTSQPPLFNLYAGVLLKLPTGARRPVEVLCSLTLGLAMVLCAYLLQVELRVPRVAALVVTLVVVVASPAAVLYENWLDYAFPTAALGTFGAWCLVRFLRTERARFGVGFFGAYAAMVLLDSTYQPVWLVVAAVPVAVVLRRRWRLVAAVAVVPLLLVAGWAVKDYVQVGTTTTSDWLGMNLARSILYKAPAGEVAALQRQGRMNAVASVPPFAGPEVYSPRYVRAVPDADPAVGALHKSDGATNFNNPLYARVSSLYLHDDLAWIRAHPHAYADDVLNSLGVWFVGTDQNFTDSVNWPATRSYARVYDRAVEWQPVQDPAPGFVVFARGWHRPAWLSWQAVAVYALALLGAPVVAWRRRRTDPALAGALAVLWWTTTYALVTSSLLEIGENERFRAALGPVPTVVAVVVLTVGVRGLVEVGTEEPGGRLRRRSAHHPDRIRMTPPADPGGRAVGGEDVRPACRPPATSAGGGGGVETGPPSDGCGGAGGGQRAATRSGVRRPGACAVVSVHRRTPSHRPPTSPAGRDGRHGCRRSLHRQIGARTGGISETRS